MNPLSNASPSVYITPSIIGMNADFLEKKDGDIIIRRHYS
jgi:hypothetical protein